MTCAIAPDSLRPTPADAEGGGRRRPPQPPSTIELRDVPIATAAADSDEFWTDWQQADGVDA